MTPTETACLVVSLIQSKSSDTLLDLSSPFIREKYALLGRNQNLASLYSWQPAPHQTLLEHFTAIDLETNKSAPVLFRMLDESTTHSCVSFTSPALPETMIIVLVLVGDRWTLHELRVVDDLIEFTNGWLPSLDESREALLAHLEATKNATVSGPEDEYWALYTQDEEKQEEEETTKTAIENPIENEGSNSEDDYWDMY